MGGEGAEARTGKRKAGNREPALAEQQPRRQTEQQPDEALPAHPGQNQKQAQPVIS